MPPWESVVLVDEFRRAELALHRRAELACAAATGAGLSGRFEAWLGDGFRAVRITDPDLAFLSGVWCARVDRPGPARRALGEIQAGRFVPVPGDPAPPTGLRRGPDTVLALRSPGRSPVMGPVSVERAAGARFVETLLRGYAAGRKLAAFLAAEHLADGVDGYLARDGAEVLGAAAMSVNGDVAVLGGASTPPERRGRGAQSALLRCRLAAATELGCTLAVATAAADSASARNLARHGFRLYRRTSWSSAGTGGARPASERA